MQKLIEQFQSSTIVFEKFESQTPIQIVIVSGNNDVKNLSDRLQENNLDVRAILYPTVPKGKERLRIVLHSFNTEAELKQLIVQLNYC